MIVDRSSETRHGVAHHYLPTSIALAGPHSYTVGGVRAALGQGQVCLVVNEERIVLGLVRAEALGPDDDRPVSEIMDEGPSTYRPHVPAAGMAERLDEHPQPRILVTTLDGRLVGMASAEDITETTGRAGP